MKIKEKNDGIKFSLELSQSNIEFKTERTHREEQNNVNLNRYYRVNFELDE